MSNSFDWFNANAVLDYALKGEGTGATSKNLSLLTFPIITVLAVQLIKDQQYIPLVLLCLLMYTKIGLFAVLAVLVYFVITNYWIGTALLIIYSVISGLSLLVGYRNVKRLYLSDKPMIGPFDDMPDVLLIKAFACLSLSIALFAHGWFSTIFWALFGIAVLYIFYRQWFRLHPRWSQIHQPMMVRYTAAAVYDYERARAEGRKPDIYSATKSMIRSVYPNKQDAEIDDIVCVASKK